MRMKAGRLGRCCWEWPSKRGVRVWVREGRARWEARSLAGCRMFYLIWFLQPTLEIGSIMPILQLNKLRLGEAQRFGSKVEW